MTPTELHLANLNVLLSGKGAKSALARLLSLSPASVTGMLNGVKPLDDDLRLSVTRALHLSEDWFEKARTGADIPANTSKLLSPLARGASAPPAAPRVRHESKGPTTPPAGSAGSASPAAPAAAQTTMVRAPAPQPEEKPQSWPVTGTKVSRLRGLTDASTQAPVPGPSAPGTSTPAAPSAAGAPAANAPVSSAAPASALSTPVPSEPARGEPRAVPEQQRGDAYPGMTAVLSEFALSPIAEALIKTLARKASSGALSEDKAFELLGSVRAL